MANISSLATHSRRVRLLGLVAIVTLTIAGLSACGSDHPSAHAGKTGKADASSSTSTGSPLDTYLGAGGGSTATLSATHDREYQEAIARCMAAQGFDYVPEPAGAITSTPMAGGGRLVKLDRPSFPDLPAAQFAARYGYGITTAPSTSGAGPVDPNDKLVAKMSVAERVAYQHALYGENTPLTARGYLTTSINESPAACTAKAAKVIPSDAKENALEHRIQRAHAAYKSLLDRINALDDQEMADPRMRAADQDWSKCLAAAGFPGYSGIDQPRAKMLSRARALMGQDLDPATADPMRLADLRRTEVRLAVADNTCRKAWDKTFAAVRRDVEMSFVHDNLTELKRYRSALAAASQ
jgi:hypothetical protein